VILYRIEQFIDGVLWYTKCTVSQINWFVFLLQQLESEEANQATQYVTMVML